MIRPERGRAEPEVPIKRGRDGGHIFGAFGDEGAGGGFVGPEVHFANVADDAGLQNLDEGLEGGCRVELDAHLRDDFVPAGRGGNRAGFVDGVCQRFFAIDVLTHFDCGHRGDGVDVVGGGDEDGVYVVSLLEHYVKILVGGTGLICAGSLLGCVVAVDDVAGGLESRGAAVIKSTVVGALVDIADGDDVHGGLFEKNLHIGSALTAGADAGDVELLAWRGVAGAAEDVPGDNRKRGRGCGGAQEVTARDFIISLFVSFLAVFHIRISTIFRVFIRQ